MKRTKLTATFPLKELTRLVKQNIAVRPKLTPTVQDVKIGDIDFSLDVQRGLKMSTLRKMIKNFDPSLAGYPTLVGPNSAGRYLIQDSRHRTTAQWIHYIIAALDSGQTITEQTVSGAMDAIKNVKIKAFVCKGNISDAADVFIGINGPGSRNAVHPVANLRVALQSKDRPALHTEAVKIFGFYDSIGFSLVEHPVKPNEIGMHSEFKTLINAGLLPENDWSLMARAIKIAADVWATLLEDNPSQSTKSRSLDNRTVLAVYGLLNFCPDIKRMSSKDIADHIATCVHRNYNEQCNYIDGYNANIEADLMLLAGPNPPERLLTGSVDQLKKIRRPKLGQYLITGHSRAQDRLYAPAVYLMQCWNGLDTDVVLDDHLLKDEAKLLELLRNGTFRSVRGEVVES